MPRPARGSRTATKRDDDDDEIDKKVRQPVSAAKRKAESEPDSAKAAKKTKKKGKADDDGMVLAERTAVSSLKKAMYIGAHVSAAGGNIISYFIQCNLPC